MIVINKTPLVLFSQRRAKLHVSLRVLTVLALFIGATQLGATNILNGSFELTTGHTTSFLLTTTAAPDDWTFTPNGNGSDAFAVACLVMNADVNACNTTNFAHSIYSWTQSPDGGNFVAVDGTPRYSGTLSQSISTVAGQTYTITFYQAGAQFSPYTGATTENWQVSLGNETLNSALMSNASGGFTGWTQQSLTFVANMTGTQLLSFFAVGSPAGEPPVVLLDGVSFNTATPEPAPYFLVGAGLTGIALLRRRIKK